MPVSPFYKRMAAKVDVPGKDDPVDVQQVGRDSYMDFSFGSREPAAAAPAGSLVQGLRDLLFGEQAQPQPARLGIGNLRMMDEQAMGGMAAPSSLPQLSSKPARPGIGNLRMMDEQAMGGMAAPSSLPQLSSKPARPPQSYGLNRGGTGKAGQRKEPPVQLGAMSFDIPPMPEALQEMDDKPWELDEQTKQDVTPGLSLTPKPEENVVDKEPDLQTPRGMYEALAKRYPDILTQNLDQLRQSRVTPEDIDALRDRSGLGSLFIAASKAASGAGSVGGKTAESIAPDIVSREDTLARQRLKDRMDVANENMLMNARAVDLAIKQINFADEREQYDPNSDVSKFARQFMKDEFQVTVPDTVPAYQLKQFLPAVVQKYQAEERAKYQSALLGQRTEESAAQQQFKATESEKDRNLRLRLAQEAAQAKKQAAAAKPAPKVPQTPREKLQNKLIEKDAEVYQKRMQGLQKLDGGLKSLDDAQTAGEVVQIGQSLLKTLNDTENSDAVGAEEVKRLASELQTFSIMTPNKLIQIGRDLPAFKQRVKVLRERLYNTLNIQFQSINQKMPDLVDPPPTYGTPAGGATGMSPERKARLEELRRKLRGGQ